MPLSRDFSTFCFSPRFSLAILALWRFDLLFDAMTLGAVNLPLRSAQRAV